MKKIDATYPTSGKLQLRIDDESYADLHLLAFMWANGNLSEAIRRAVSEAAAKVRQSDPEAVEVYRRLTRG